MTMSDDDTLLRVEGLTKHYTTSDGLLDKLLGVTGQIEAVDGVDLEVQKGETIGLVGESGCGKSSLGRTILQLEEPTAGSVYFRGTDLTQVSRSELRSYRKEVQMIFQDPLSSLNPRLTVGDIIGEALDIHGLPEGAQTREERVQELLEAVELSPAHTNRYPHEFSGGQQQRVGIARALAVEPEFIVCDEPVSALDVSVQAQILNLLKRLQDEYGHSYLFIAHDLSVVEHIADRIAVMYLGNIVEQGTPEQIFESDSHPYTEALLSAIPVPDPKAVSERILLKGTVPSPQDPPSGCRFHTRCPRVIPPVDYDFDQAAWRSVLDLRAELMSSDATLTNLVPPLDDPVAELDESTVTRLIRENAEIPAELSDPEAEQVLQTALTTAAEGDLDAAGEQLAAAFTTVCETDDPILVARDGVHPISCHLFDDDQPGSISEDVAVGGE